MIPPSDALEISELYARYAHYFDNVEPELWASLFTPDGRFIRPAPQPIVEGTQELAGFVREANTLNPGMKHFVSNISLDEGPGGVRARAYFLALRMAPGDSVRLRNAGTYEDVIVKHDGAWRFSEHRITSWVSPEVVDGAFVFEKQVEA